MKLLLKYLHPSNIGTYIYTALNYLLLVGLLHYVFEYEAKQAFLIIGIIYLCSFLFAISPLGEIFLRLTTGCRKIKDSRILNRINPLYHEVFNRAKAYYPYLRKPFKLYMKNDDSINAFAVGRNTICFNRGLLALDDDSIKGILAHEIGHHACRDTTFLLVISITNLMTNVIIIIAQFLINVISFVFALIFSSERNYIWAVLIRFILIIPFTLIVKFWQLICNLLISYSARQNEYEADLFALEIGYGPELRYALSLLDSSTTSYSWYEKMFISHPETHKRIEKLSI